MAKIYDVPADQLVLKLAETLKSEDIPAPEWAPFVKTGVHANKPPQKSDWWYTRCASLLRKIYVHGPMGINELCSMYGGGKPHGYGMAAIVTEFKITFWLLQRRSICFSCSSLT